MGILNGKHVFTSKFVTAIIIDASNRAFFVPIKHPIGNYFLAKIDQHTYAFKLDGTKNLIYRHTLAKTFQFCIYYTNHYTPISPNEDLIKQFLKDHHLPKINNIFANFLRFIGRIETPDAIPHNIDTVLEVMDKSTIDDSMKQKIKTYIESLPTKQIVTSVRPISDYIDETIRSTDAQFMGSIITALDVTDYEHKKISNTPITAKKPMIKLVAIMLIVAVIGTAIWWAYDTGKLNSVIPTIGNTNPLPSDIIMDQYSDPGELQNAVNNGTVNKNDLPDDVQRMLDELVKLPSSLVPPILSPSTTTPTPAPTIAPAPTTPNTEITSLPLRVNNMLEQSDIQIISNIDEIRQHVFEIKCAINNGTLNISDMTPRLRDMLNGINIPNSYNIIDMKRSVENGTINFNDLPVHMQQTLASLDMPVVENIINQKCAINRGELATYELHPRVQDLISKIRIPVSPNP